jgi:hypothetical protein
MKRWIFLILLGQSASISTTSRRVDVPFAFTETGMTRRTLFWRDKKNARTNKIGSGFFA